MKNRLYIFILLTGFVLGSCTVNKSVQNHYYHDDLYDGPIVQSQPSNQTPVSEKESPASNEDQGYSYYEEDWQDQQPNHQEIHSSENGTTIINNYYDDYNDFSYSSRIRRFHNDWGYNYYAPIYTDMFFYTGAPSFYGTSVYYYSPWNYYDMCMTPGLSVNFYSPHHVFQYGYATPFWSNNYWHNQFYFNNFHQGGWAYNNGFHHGYYHGFHDGVNATTPINNQNNSTIYSGGSAYYGPNIYSNQTNYRRDPVSVVQQKQSINQTQLQKEMAAPVMNKNVSTVQQERKVSEFNAEKSNPGSTATKAVQSTNYQNERKAVESLNQQQPSTNEAKSRTVEKVSPVQQRTYSRETEVKQQNNIQYERSRTTPSNSRPSNRSYKPATQSTPQRAQPQNQNRARETQQRTAPSRSYSPNRSRSTTQKRTYQPSPSRSTSPTRSTPANRSTNTRNSPSRNR